MNIIHQPLDNIGGNKRSIWILPCSDVPANIRIQKGLVLDNLNLSSWNRIDFTFDTLRFEEVPVDAGGNTGYLKTLSGAIARDRKEFTDILQKYRNTMVVVVFEDRNGVRKLIGTKECPALFKYNRSNGPKPDDMNMYQVDIIQTDKSEAPYYQFE